MKSVGAALLCNKRSINESTRASGADVESADMRRMVRRHVIQERLEAGEGRYGDRLERCVGGESTCQDECERTL